MCQGWKKCSCGEWNKQQVAVTDLGQVLAELHVLTLYGWGTFCQFLPNKWVLKVLSGHLHLKTSAFSSVWRQNQNLLTCFLATLRAEPVMSPESGSLYFKRKHLITGWEPDKVKWRNILADRDTVGWLFISCTVTSNNKKKQPSSTWCMFTFVLRCYHVASSHDRRLHWHVFLGTLGVPLHLKTVNVKTACMRLSSPLCFWELSSVPLAILGLD